MTADQIAEAYFRKDGSRVPVLVGAATFGESENQGVAFVLDLTERKQAEAEAREGERRYRETQTQLAHANRVATMGQLEAVFGPCDHDRPKVRAHSATTAAKRLSAARI
jgi:PAS domain-containing protein